MNKSILIIRTPDNCYDCKLEYDCYKCSITNSSFFGREDFDPAKNVMSDCPLRPVPEKSLTGKSDYYQWGDWEDGYNQCIDEILENKE